ncbi:MAG: class I SAM-dependent methyltransferase [Planctomycetota bacterium]|nr:class I SAM-dependent methyltransferase [Planctomycetota bacterium]
MRRWKQMKADWYEFPGWYDILHTPGTALELKGLERIEWAHVGAVRRRRWLEPACGTARLLRLAARRGITVAGFDRSERMIEYARQSFASRGLRGALFVADMTDFALPGPRRPATFAFCTINTLRHLPSDAAMLAHFERVRAALHPAGVYAVGLETCRYGLEFPSEDVWTGSRGGAKVTQVVQYQPPTRADRRERVVSHLSIQLRGSGTARSRTEHLDSTYDLRSYSHAQWLELVDRARWRIVAVCDPMGDPAMLGPRGHVIGGYALWVLAPGRAARRGMKRGD